MGRHNGLCEKYRMNLSAYSESIELKSPVVTIRTTRFNVQQFYVLRAPCIYVFCVDLRTNSDYFCIQR